MFSLCCSQKRQDNFVLSELRNRVSAKLGPAVRKQKINTFKLLSNAQLPQCDTCWMVTREVKSSNPIGVILQFHVLFASFSVKKTFTERQCLCLSFLYQIKSLRIK